MKPSDIFILAGGNLKQNKVRTLLTILGVAIGIGSLATMIAFAVGMQNNISKSLEKNDLFTGITVTGFNFEPDSYNIFGAANFIEKNRPVPIDEKMLEKIKSFPNVAVAFPEVVKPARILFNGKSTSVNIKSVPAMMADFRPFDNIKYGKFYSSDSENGVVVSKAVLQKMDIIVQGDDVDVSTKNFTVLPADSIIGKNIEIITTVFDIEKIDLLYKNSRELPVKSESTFLPICGIVESNSFSAGMFSGGIFLPPKTCDAVPSVDLKNVYDIINNYSDSGIYNSIHVRVSDFTKLEDVKYKIEKLGLQVFSIGDKLQDMKKVFFLLDSLLAAIGIIALLVAALGIVNTLMMAIYERRKEIGIMKSMGATAFQIRLIFYVEAAFMGFVGGILGVVAGKLAAMFANSVANSQIGHLLESQIEYFSFSWQLILGAILFSVVVSFLSAVYPAARASSIDPLLALRRE